MPLISNNRLTHEQFEYQHFLPFMKPKKETWKKMVGQRRNVPSTVKVRSLLNNSRVN
jgi:hypothetical protein